MSIECHPCGREIATPHADGLYYDGDELPCECGAVSIVSCDAETDPYVGSYRCKHGISEWDGCDACDHEDNDD